MLLRPAPAWQTTTWFNSPQPLSLEALRGQVILLHAFQMLCPGCVSRGIPQAQRVAQLFQGAPVVVVGLHSVFEHHEAMQPQALKAFLHEYRIRFPVGVDTPGPNGGVPLTMEAYGMEGTPTTVLIDALGRRRRQVFGAHEDLLLGAELQALITEADQLRAEGAFSSGPKGMASHASNPDAAPEDGGCGGGSCPLPT